MREDVRRCCLNEQYRGSGQDYSSDSLEFLYDVHEAYKQKAHIFDTVTEDARISRTAFMYGERIGSTTRARRR